MGNSSGYESRNSDEEEGIVEVIKGRYDYTKIYWDIDGNLRYGQTDKNRDEEVCQFASSMYLLSINTNPLILTFLF